MYVSIDDKIVSSQKLKEFNNRAFKYGDGLFESIRISNGKILNAQRHFNRLRSGMKLLQMEVNNDFNLEFFCNQIEKVIAINEIKEGARLRYTVYRNAEGFYTPTSNEFSTFIEIQSLPTNYYEFNEKGLITDVGNSLVLQNNQWANLKSINALPYVMASIEMQKKNLDNLILLNAENRIVETANSNIFLIKGNKIFTPKLSEGCVSGVMRATIIDQLASANYSVLEECLHVDTLYEAEEIFISNAIIGINWVAAIGKKRYLNKKVRSIFNHVFNSFVD